MKYNSFNKSNIKTARLDFQNALNRIGEQFGVKILLGNINYLDHEIKSKVTITIDSPAAAAKAVERVPSFVEIGKKIIIGGVEYVVSGYKPRSNKYPVCVKRVRDGKGFKVTHKMAGF